MPWLLRIPTLGGISPRIVPIISTPRLYQEGQSSHLIYLQAAREAQNLGCSVINFGRSIDGSGPALFKKRFGLEATPLLMYSPNENWTVTDPNKSFLRYFVAIWKKLFKQNKI